MLLSVEFKKFINPIGPKLHKSFLLRENNNIKSVKLIPIAYL